MIEKNINGFKVLYFKSLENIKNIFCCITTKIYENKPIFNAINYDISKNYLFKKFLKSIESENYFYLNQKHTANVFHLQNTQTKTEFNMDGVITQLKGKLLIGFSADCSLSIFYDKKNQAIGICHAGWRGALLDIYGNMFRNMQLHFNTQKENLFVGIGPFISAENYPVDKSIIKKFINIYGLAIAKNFYLKKEQQYYLDIKSILKFQLKRLGIKKYEFADLCTYEKNDIFYSWRRGEKGHFTICAKLI